MTQREPDGLRLHLDEVLLALDPHDVAWVEGEVVLEHPPKPDARGIGVGRHADPPSLEVGWCGDLAVVADQQVAELRAAGMEHREVLTGLAHAQRVVLDQRGAADGVCVAVVCGGVKIGEPADGVAVDGCDHVHAQAVHTHLAPDDGLGRLGPRA